VKGIPAQGQRATDAQSSNQATAGTQRADERGSSRAGTRGAGQQAGRLGQSGAQRDSAGPTQSLPLRTLATNGGRERGTSAGKAGTGGKGRGAARVQSGTGAGGDGGSPPAPLSFVPTDVNVIAPYLRALVSAYFPLR
jgi:hypothetical protein